MERDIKSNFNFKSAKERVSKVINKTELIKSDYFSDKYGNEVYIKPENLQKTGAFKIRGAYNKIYKLSDEEKKKGLISASAGNHAQGVAYACSVLGVKAKIVMPKTTPLIKVEGTKKYGAEVILYGDCYDEACEYAVKLSEEKGYTFIHPFNDINVIEGQGTIGSEILEELPDCDVILVPVGGGGLISGITLAAKEIKPDVKIVGVEPLGAASMKESVEVGRVINLPKISTVADGAAVKSPGDITFEIVKKYVDEIVVADDFEIMEAFTELLEKHKLIGESAGLLSLAGISKIKEKGKKIVSVVSGGNIDVLSISTMINKGLVSKGRIFGFNVNLPDKPGELLNISKILASTGANVVKVDHDQFRSADRFTDVILHVKAETNGYEHIEKIKEELRNSGYDIELEI